MPGAGLSDGCSGKALSEMPAIQPYWGKPAVRNDRGDSGNVGIIRSPIRATVLPDCGGRSAMVVPTATVGPDCPFKMALIFFRLVGLFPRFAFDVHEFAMQIGART